MPETLVAIRVADAGNHDLEWAEGLRLSLPVDLVTLLWPRGGNSWSTARLPRKLTDEGRRRAVRAARELREMAAFTEAMPLSSRLPVSYQHVPGLIRRSAARIIGRVKRTQVSRWAAFPGWPLDLSADFAADLAGLERGPLATGPTPVLLTHDLDSAEGLRNLVRDFLAVEESVGARSTSYLVPCAWTVDHGLVDEVRRRGHEIGIHGYDHSNRTPFAGARERRSRLDAARPLIERYGITGYRSPSLLRTRALLEDLSLRYRYDSSIPTSGGLFPVPNNGCASARPFQICGIWEIPLTLPRDGSLKFLGYAPDDIRTIWTGCADRIARSGGIVSLLTHCESGFSGNATMRSVYMRFVESLAEAGNFFFTTPREIVRRLEQGVTT